jgi:hypothetical protein
MNNESLTSAQRNLNNCFAYDLVPSPSVIISALKAARRVNDFPSAVRVFEGTSTRTVLQAQLHFLLAICRLIENIPRDL